MKLFTLLLLPVVLSGAQARYARLGEFEGTVEVQLRAHEAWVSGQRNLPLPESSWVRTGLASRLEIELDEGSVWRLGPNSQFEISDYTRLSTGQKVTLLSLDHGLAYFTGQQEGKDALILAVPGAQLTLTRSARLRMEVQENWSQIWVLEGTVRFSSPAAEIELREGQTTRVEPANPARFFLNKESTPMESDRWSEERDKALRSSTSAGHVIHRYGLADLDTAGEWTQTEELGPVWKPTAQDGWSPYQRGKWRWYDTLGYTWVSDDPWGWLPYHYGRWTRWENLGWVWVPAKNAIFKPAEVYWLRAAKFVGWGPLAPGEDWKSSGPDAGPPVQYHSRNTTFAAFGPDAPVIDPEGFTARPKDPLLTMSFAIALPSPALPAGRLDITRPELRAGSTRVVPVLEGVTFQNSKTPAPTIVITNPPPPPPVVVITPPPAEPPATVEVGYPVPVYTGIVINAPSQPNSVRRPTSPAPNGPPPVTNAAASRPLAGPRRESIDSPVKANGRHQPDPVPPASGVTRGKRFHSGERDIAGEVMKDVNSNNFAKALVDLETWSQRYHDSDYVDDRQYYLVLAHNGLQHPAKVLDAAGPLVAKAGQTTLDDPRQIILVLYLASLNAQKLASPTREQFATSQNAARQLMKAVPDYFTEGNRPPATAPADWAKARTDLELVARTTLRGSRH